MENTYVKDVEMIVYTPTPGWFVDEAYRKGLMTATRVDSYAMFTGHQTSCRVKICGPKGKVDEFIKYCLDRNYDVSMITIEEL